MFDQTPHSNPETIFHTEQLRQERRKNRRWGYASIVGGILFLLFTLLNIALWIFSSALQPHDTQTLIVIVLMTLGGITLTAFGFTELRATAQDITSQEVAQRRQSTRMHLTQQAQGKLNWQLTRRGSIIALCIACLLIFCGLETLLISFPWSLKSWITLPFTLLFFLEALHFVVMAVWTRPYLAKTLPAQSAQELHNRLILGELTAGNQADGELTEENDEDDSHHS